jgi:SAM-dependent methyltransferase
MSTVTGQIPRVREAATSLRRRVITEERVRPFVTPGAGRLHELRWERLTARAPVVTQEEHAAKVGVGEIEEMIACDLCGEQRIQPLFRVESRQRGRWVYHVVRCPECGFLYRNPGVRAERLGDLYEGEYGEFLTGAYARKRKRRYKAVMRAFSPLFARGEGRRLLDFGCGAGLFLDVAHRRGFDCYGVDLSEDSIERARERPSGARTWHGTPRDVPEIAAGGFHVVTLWSVLAHLAEPVRDLRMVRELLAPDGVALILTVNANSLLLKARRERWNGFTPNHLKFFSPTTLPLLLRAAGFGAVVFKPMYGDGVETGRTLLSSGQQARLRRNVDRGNQANMMRAVAFADPDGPGQWGLGADAIPLNA